MALQSTMYQKQNIDVSAAPWTMHEFFAGSGLVAYGLKGMFAPVWANDISEQKAAVYEANFGCDRFILDDIKNIKGSVLPFAHLSWASFPCQDLSLAGSIGGIHASRSGLVWEWLRVLDGPLPFLPFWPESGVSGMRMVVFSVLLLIIILFFRNGLFGHNEVTWSSIGRRLKTLSGHGMEVSRHE